jgi:hypothetical protein
MRRTYRGRRRMNVRLESLTYGRKCPAVESAEFLRPRFRALFAGDPIATLCLLLNCQRNYGLAQVPLSQNIRAAGGGPIRTAWALPQGFAHGISERRTSFSAWWYYNISDHFCQDTKWPESQILLLVNTTYYQARSCGGKALLPGYVTALKKLLPAVCKTPQHRGGANDANSHKWTIESKLWERTAFIRFEDCRHPTTGGCDLGCRAVGSRFDAMLDASSLRQSRRRAREQSAARASADGGP